MDHDVVLQAIGGSIRARREATGLSRDELADRLGWTPVRLAEVECGDAEPTMLEFVAMARSMGVPASQLMSEALPADSRLL